MNYSNIEALSESINIVFNLYRNFGDNDYIGEKVTQLEHALQCAHQAALEYPENNHIILGAFLHDIGHLLSLHNEQNVNNKLFECKNKSLNGLGLVDHENIGADFLEKMGFPKSITSLGRNHVLAKRYLITNTPDYLENLSEASKETFKMQGGILSSSEKQSFEDIEGNDIFIRMRHWDDMAKNTNFKYLNGINYYEKMALETLIRA